MKKTVTVVMVLMVLLLAGCAKSPSSVTRQYISAIQKNNIEKATQYVTSETAGVLQASLDSQRTKYGAFTVTIFKEQINGNEAVVTVQLPSGSSENINLAKENDEWKVSLK